MLSTSLIKNAGQASSYFMERDDYYRKEGECFEQPSRWYGKGARRLNLIGEVDKKTFDALLTGKLPDGTQIGVNRLGGSKHRAGFDLTLSVPKSWSIAHYVTKDPLFAKITEEAAQLTADLIERDCAMASCVENGKQVAELTGNLVFAFHYHRLSREGDMQDHIHMNVMNLTQRKDLEWRALKSDDPKKLQHDYSEGFLERVRARKKHYGDVFSLHIAHLAQKNHLAVAFDEQGKWELSGISKEMIQAFSTRRQQIEQHMAEKGVEGANAAEVSALATRKRKQDLSRETIEASLNDRLSAFPTIQMENLQISPSIENKVEIDQEAEKAIDYAIAHVSETNDVFTEEKLLVCAMKQYHAKLSPQALLEAIAAKEAQKALYVLEDKGSRRFVSALHVEREKAILSLIPRSKNQIGLIETKNQHADKFINSIPKRSYFSKFEPVVLCLSKKEAEDKALATKLPCFSVSHYLAQSQYKQEQAPQLLIVDQAHRLSTQQGHQLLTLLQKQGHRSLMLYDNQQPQNLQPGHFIKLLLDHGVNTQKFDCALSENRKLAAVRHEISEKEERLEKIAADYVSYRVHEPQKSVLILAQNKGDAKVLNQKVQDTLFSQGLLGKEKIEIEHYQSIFMTAAQLTQANHYKRGQIVSFSKNYTSLGVKQHEYYAVENSVSESNQVWLRVGNKRIVWDPSKVGGARAGVVKVFSPQSTILHQDDKVVTTATVQGVAKDRTFTVNKITPKGVVLLGENKRKLTVKKSDALFHHIALGYAKTVATGYAHTADVILAEQTSGTRVTHAKAYYQMLNQAKEQIYFYTDDLDSHLLTLEKYKGEAKPIVSHFLEKCRGENKVKESPVAALEGALQKTVKREPGLFSGKPKNLLYKLAKYTISQLSEREAVFTQHQLAQMIAEKNKALAGQLDFSSLGKVFNALTKKGVLIPCALYGDEAFTTKRALKLEAGIFQEVKALMGGKQATFQKEELAVALHAWQKENKNLTLSQQMAVERVLLTPHKLILINGLAGVGKTTLLEAVNGLLKEKAIGLIGLAPTNEAVRQLKMRGLQAHTMDAYLGMLERSHQEGKFDPAAKELLVLDEASMASSKKLSRLLSLTKNSQISLAFIGDIKQLPSIEQGKMFWQLQKLGVETTLVDEIVRQKAHPEHLSLIKKLYQGDFKGVIAEMDQKGMVVEDKTEGRIQKLVDLISNRSATERENTCVITPANRDRNEYNLLYREALKKNGELSLNEHSIKVLTQVDLTATEKPHAVNYQKDQVLLFHRAIPDCEIKFGEYLTVKNVDGEKNYLVLENQRGEQTGINMARFRGVNSHHLSVYEWGTRALAEGECIRWRYTDKGLDRINMQQAKVIAVEQNQVTIMLENKQTQVLDLTAKRDLHWDYAYASTVFTEQGNTKQFAALYMTSDQKHLASQPGFLVAMTRAVESGLLVTDDKDKLVRRIEQTSGIKTSSLEALGYQRQEGVKLGGIESHLTRSQPVLTKGKEQAIIQKEREI